MSEQVPIFSVSDLKSVYLTDQSERYASLKTKFCETFDSAPEFYCRSPGRVNIIGEHIDYHGYGVLPMALSDHDVIVAVRPNKEKIISIYNTDKNFPGSKFNLDFEIDSQCHQWYNYALAGVKGILETQENDSNVMGMDIMMDGNIPPGAGVSSSSALVCSFAIATCHSNNLNFSKTEIAEISSRSERYVGTQGGGMDQAASILSKRGSAQYIQFKPLKSTLISLPKTAKFVVAHSMVESRKATEASQYNIRVAEGRIGAQMLAHFAEISVSESANLRDIQEALGFTLEEMITFTEQKLALKLYTFDDVMTILGKENAALLRYKSIFEKKKGMKCRQRVLHVYSEAHRVMKFVETASNVNGVDDELIIQQLGDLMNQSQNGCDIQYECSCPELDKLVSVSRSAGSVGARLTGAGWGGCTVSLVTEKKVDKVINEIKAQGYKLVFLSSLGGGACIFR